MKKVFLAMLFAGLVMGFSCKKSEAPAPVEEVPMPPAVEVPAPVTGATVQPGATAVVPGATAVVPGTTANPAQ